MGNCSNCTDNGHLYIVKPDNFDAYSGVFPTGYGPFNSNHPPIYYSSMAGNNGPGFFTSINFNKGTATLSVNPVSSGLSQNIAIQTLLYTSSQFDYEADTNVFLPTGARKLHNNGIDLAWYSRDIMPSGAPQYFTSYKVTEPRIAAIYYDNECYDDTNPLIVPIYTQEYESCNCSTKNHLITNYTDSLKMGLKGPDVHFNLGHNQYYIYSADLYSTISINVCIEHLFVRYQPPGDIYPVYTNSQTLRGYRKVGESLIDAAQRTVNNSPLSYTFTNSYGSIHLYQNCSSILPNDVITGYIIPGFDCGPPGSIQSITEYPFSTDIIFTQDFTQNIITVEADTYNQLIDIHNDDIDLDFMAFGFNATLGDFQPAVKFYKYLNDYRTQLCDIPEIHSLLCKSYGRLFESSYRAPINGLFNTTIENISIGQFDLCDISVTLDNAQIYDNQGNTMFDVSGIYENLYAQGILGINNARVGISISNQTIPAQYSGRVPAGTYIILSGVVYFGVNCLPVGAINFFEAYYNFVGTTLTLVALVKLGDPGFSQNATVIHSRDTYTINNSFSVTLDYD